VRAVVSNQLLLFSASGLPNPNRILKIYGFAYVIVTLRHLAGPESRKRVRRSSYPSVPSKLFPQVVGR
jgi:hypothetical protein